MPKIQSIQRDDSERLTDLGAQPCPSRRDKSIVQVMKNVPSHGKGFASHVKYTGYLQSFADGVLS